MNSVIFVFIGKKLPHYGDASLRLAKSSGGILPILVAPRTAYRSSLSEACEFHALEDFYDRDSSGIQSVLIDADLGFRNGLWIRSLERFFVLREFMVYLNIDDCLHAELDQLLFRADLLLKKLRTLLSPAIYLPFHTEKAAVASMLYVNHMEPLDALLEFSKKIRFNNEMELISKFGFQHYGAIQALPTLASYANPDHYARFNHPRVSVQSLGGVLDAAQVGQWVAGIDPRNVPIRNIPRSRFVDEPHPDLLSVDQLERLRFQLASNSGLLNVELEGYEPVVLFNLHLHSKVHQQLLKKEHGIVEMLHDSNLGVAVFFKQNRRRQTVAFLLDHIKILAQPKRILTFLRKTLRSHLNHYWNSFPR
jgi:hypothetical protein